MRTQIFFLAALFNLCSLVRAAELREVASFPNRQVTGVAVSKTGRIFVNFPDWSDDHTISVAQLHAGQPNPFPSADWNKPGPAASHFVCVQSVYIDANDNLWVLDPAAPKMQKTVTGGPKLIKIDLTTNQIAQTIPFPENIAPAKSYLNDVRVDTTTNTAFITDSGEGAIIVVDLSSGKARRLLADHKSTKAAPDVKLVIERRELIDQEKNKPPQINSDGIALDSKNGYLYYHALTAHTLYRIKTQYLKDESLSEGDLASKVENVAQTSTPDGMLEAPDGSIYLTDLEHNAVVHFDPVTKKITTVMQDRQLHWPDTMSWGQDGMLYVTASQIENMPRFNGGHSRRSEPYKLFKFRP